MSDHFQKHTLAGWKNIGKLWKEKPSCYLYRPFNRLIRVANTVLLCNIPRYVIEYYFEKCRLLLYM